MIYWPIVISCAGNHTLLDHLHDEVDQVWFCRRSEEDAVKKLVSCWQSACGPELGGHDAASAAALVKCTNAELAPEQAAGQQGGEGMPLGKASAKPVYNTAVQTASDVCNAVVDAQDGDCADGISEGLPPAATGQHLLTGADSLSRTATCSLQCSHSDRVQLQSAIAALQFLG